MNRRLTAVLLLLAVSIVARGKREENEPAGTWIGQTAGLAGPQRE